MLVHYVMKQKVITIMIEKEIEVSNFEFEASIGMEEIKFSGDASNFEQLDNALTALVRKFRGSSIPCHFSLEGKRCIDWNFLIDKEDLSEFLEKLDKLEGDFSNE